MFSSLNVCSIYLGQDGFVFNSITIEGLLSPPSGQEKKILISMETEKWLEGKGNRTLRVTATMIC